MEAHTVISPWAVMIHFKHASVTLTAMMNPIHFFAPTFIAKNTPYLILLLRVLILCLYFLLISVCWVTPLNFIFIISEFKLSSEIFPFEVPRISWRTCYPVTPKRHCSKEKGYSHLNQQTPRL